MKARDMLEPKERVIAVFTYGHHFTRNDDHSGSIGHWHIDAERAKSLDRVIIYHRDEPAGNNKLYIASMHHIEPTSNEPKHVIFFEHCQFAGITNENWNSFAEAGSSVIRYLP